MRLALAAIVIAASSLPARAEVAEPGVNVEGCLPTVTCSAEIERKGKAYHLTWLATDRTGRTTYCRYTAKLKIGTGTHREERIPGVLIGTLSGTKDEVLIMPTGPGQVWMFVDANVCPQSKLPRSQGIIGMNGMYDLEGDI